MVGGKLNLEGFNRLVYILGKSTNKYLSSHTEILYSVYIEMNITECCVSCTRSIHLSTADS